MQARRHGDIDVALTSSDGCETTILSFFEAERLMRDLGNALREAAPAMRPLVAAQLDGSVPRSSAWREHRDRLDRLDLVAARMT